MRRLPVIALLLAATATATTHAAPASRPHNLILFVADGLRGGIVSPETAPAMAALAARGVSFPNSHSLFPTFTTANASALATGHYLGDTGDFSNTLYTGFAVKAAKGSVTPFVESDPVLAELDAQFQGNYLNEETVLAAARCQGYGAAAIGKLGPARIQDHRTGDRCANPAPQIVIDDATGGPAGLALPTAISNAIAAAGLRAAAPGRGLNGGFGDFHAPGTLTANIDQQRWFADVASKAVLPLLGGAGKPFVMVYWSRDPDGSQHFQGDSLGKLKPGIDGPTSLAAIRNADNNLAQLEAALKAQGLFETTDIIVTADHGFSVISKASRTSPAARATYDGVVPGELPQGFVALDLASALGMQAFDPDAGYAAIVAGTHPSRGNALLGSATAPPVIVASNGGSDLIYMPAEALRRFDRPRADPLTGKPIEDLEIEPSAEVRSLARRIVTALLAQDYTGAVFLDDELGPVPGTLPLSAIGFVGRARLPRPAIVVGFRTWSTGCAVPTNCEVEIADTNLQTGQGMHGSFGRGDTFNFMAAAGPDFRRGWRDLAPTSNADLGRTMAHLLGLRITANGHLIGRVLGEAMPGGRLPAVRAGVLRSTASAHGVRTILKYQRVGTTAYYDAAGRPGRTLGLPTTAVAP